MINSTENAPAVQTKELASRDQEILAHIENDWRDALGLAGKIQEVGGITPAPSAEYYQNTFDLKTAQASELLATIEKGDEDADAAKAALLELESEPAGYRAGWAKAAVEGNARSAGLDYLDDGYDELAKDPSRLQTAIFAGQVAALVAARPGDEQKFASFAVDGYAKSDRIGEEDFRAAVQNVYPMLKAVKNGESSVGDLGGRDGVRIYGSETVTSTPTPYGLTISEHIMKYDDERPDSVHLYIHPTPEDK